MRMTRLRRIRQRVSTDGTPGLHLVESGPRGIRPRTPVTASPADQIEASAARLLHLVSYRPRLTDDELAQLNTPVVAAISRTNYVSANTDRTRLSVLYRYAAWVLRSEGTFDLTKLDDRRLHAYRLQGCDELRPTSRDTAFSILRTVRHAAPADSGIRMTRSTVTDPYADTEWLAYRRAADDLTGHPWHTDAVMLLDLSGELGLRSSEINAITGLHLTLLDSTVVLRTPGAGCRRLLASGDLATRLTPWAARGDHLLRPHYAKRGNTANFVAERVTHHNQAFGGFQCRRARHRWIARLLTQPIPTVTVLHLAGLDSDNHTLTDVARHVRDNAGYTVTDHPVVFGGPTT